jgi:hypothetical protein
MLDPLPHIIDSLPTPDSTRKNHQPSINRIMGRNETPDIKTCRPTKLSTIGSRHPRYDTMCNKYRSPGPELPFRQTDRLFPSTDIGLCSDAAEVAR